MVPAAGVTSRERLGALLGAYLDYCGPIKQTLPLAWTRRHADIGFTKLIIILNVGLKGWFALLDGPTVLTKQDGRRRPPRTQAIDAGQSKEESCFHAGDGSNADGENQDRYPT